MNRENCKIKEGIYAINKPVGMTSHDVVVKIRKLSGIKKVGHAGTLDPLASGVLVVGIGRQATKQLGKIVEKEKEYVADVKLGVESATDDEEGEKTQHEVEKTPELQEIKEVCDKFIGEIKQLPPRYSAVRIEGKRAYKLARGGEEFPLPPRCVEIKEIEILDYKWPNLQIRVETGMGVYVRSLARDVGEKLGVGGYLTALKRTRVGKYRLEDSKNLEDFMQS